MNQRHARAWARAGWSAAGRRLGETLREARDSGRRDVAVPRLRAANGSGARYFGRLKARIDNAERVAHAGGKAPRPPIFRRGGACDAAANAQRVPQLLDATGVTANGQNDRHVEMHHDAGRKRAARCVRRPISAAGCRWLARAGPMSRKRHTGTSSVTFRHWFRPKY